jgi:hypothetical protein
MGNILKVEIGFSEKGSFDSVIDMISELGKSGTIAKLDISQAFRLLIVNSADFDLLGIMFEGKFDIDKCLPMGCAISCSFFRNFQRFCIG